MILHKITYRIWKIEWDNWISLLIIFWMYFRRQKYLKMSLSRSRINYQAVFRILRNSLWEVIMNFRKLREILMNFIGMYLIFKLVFISKRVIMSFLKASLRFKVMFKRNLSYFLKLSFNIPLIFRLLLRNNLLLVSLQKLVVSCKII